MRDKLLKKTRALTQLLIFSAALNFLMVALVVYWYAKERPPTPICEKKPITERQTTISQASQSNQQTIRSFAGKSLSDLLQELTNPTMLENGFTHRDLAFGVLVTDYHFDEERAFTSIPSPSQSRTIVYKDIKGQQKKLKTYSDLKSEHFEAALEFGSKEIWPLTPEGLFQTLQIQKLDAEQSLKYAFYLTPHFMAVDLLFKRAETPVSKEKLLKMVLEGEWMTLAEFTEQQRMYQDLSSSQRQNLLTSYVMNGSPTAAHIMLQTDPAFAITKLNDAQATSILLLSTERSPEAAKYALTMLASPRSDSVWKAAATLLYQYTNEKVPQTLNKSIVMERFLPRKIQEAQKSPRMPLPQKISKSPAPKVSQPPPILKTNPPKNVWKRGYTVKKGDTLWKIGKMFSVDVNELKAYNNIKHEELTPGTMIIVP